MSLGDQLRDAIDRSGLSRYRIAKDADVDYMALWRFLDEDRDIRLSTVERLAEYLGLRFTKLRRGK